MIISEPPQTQGDVHFRLFGLPVRIFPFFWLSAILLGPYDKPPVVNLLLWVVAMFLSILVHELGHALMFRRFGYESRIVLYHFGGLAIPDTDHSFARPPGPKGEIQISLAGPGAEILFALAVALLLFVLGYRFPELDFVKPMGLPWAILPWVDFPNLPLLSQLLNCFFEISVEWGLLNLLPIYPLDGGQVCQQLFLLTGHRDAMRGSLMVSIVTGAAMTIVALFNWQSFATAFLFGYLTFVNLRTLQSYRSRGPWY